ncbi:MAG TPA: hypothetical protein VIJ14_08040 [Rhabdochlamydiaceae bacterium]
MTVWKGYIAQEFGSSNPLGLKLYTEKPIRLTCMEIIQLVDELMNRLEIKDKNE